MPVRTVATDAAGLLWEAREAGQRLILFRGVLDDPIGAALMAVLDQATTPAVQPGAVLAAYGRLFALLADATEMGPGPLVGDAWQDHLLRRILVDDNAFSRKAQQSDSSMGAALVEAARRDLAALQVLHRLSGAALVEALGMLEAGGLAEALVPWTALTPLADTRPPALLEGMCSLAEAPDWASAVLNLASYYARSSAGLFAQYRAFRWEADEAGGRLIGVRWPDPIRLGDLVGYERERQPLLQNTEQFLAGYRANNALLYGDRGTGKSSTVKALLNEYGDRGLRLIEVPRRSLHDLSAVMAQVRGRPERFVVFVDDLAFGEVEERHLDLKVLLEGGLEHHPDNVLVYVTSNRRHLLREYFTPDRGLIAADGEIRPGETVQEHLSLADRFGLVIAFLAPNQERYLAIATALARQHGLTLDENALRQRALQWSTRHNGLSGRTARQFVDQLVGEVGLAGRAAPASARPSGSTKA